MALPVPGYSGTPLADKLGIKTGSRVYGVDVPPDVRSVLAPALGRCEEVTGRARQVDLILAFETREDRLALLAGKATKSLTMDGSLWACWPKRSSGVATELSENVVRRIGLETGLVDVKVCAVTDTWSGLKFVRRLQDRHDGREAAGSRSHVKRS